MLITMHPNHPFKSTVYLYSFLQLTIIYLISALVGATSFFAQLLMINILTLILKIIFLRIDFCKNCPLYQLTFPSLQYFQCSFGQPEFCFIQHKAHNRYFPWTFYARLKCLLLMWLYSHRSLLIYCGLTGWLDFMWNFILIIYGQEHLLVFLQT